MPDIKFSNKYPYTDFHELNLDWVIKEVKFWSERVGKSIQKIELTGTVGLVDTYTITYSDGSTSTFDVTNGNGIASVAKTGTVGLVDTYTITFQDGSTTTFEVTNGAAAVDPTLTLSDYAADAKVTGDYFKGRYNGVISSGSVDDLNDNGGYLLLTGVTGLPENISFASLFVNSSNGRFVFKILMCDSGKVYANITDTQGPYIQVGWILLNDDLPTETFRGKKIVNFGDSIFGNFQGTTPGTYQSISSMMAEMLKADCLNAGFGGCRMASIYPTAAPWLNPFCMDELAEAIRTNNWTDADDAIANHSGDLPDYFPTTLAMIKNIDWSEIEAVTISYGANDWSANVNENDFKNAIYLGVQRLMQVNPKIKFFLLSPIYRWFDNGGNFDYDSDSAQAVNANSNTIPQFVQWCKEAAASLHIPFIDNYFSLGFCQLTIPVYYGTDTTHPIADGRYLMAQHICAGMNGNY